MPVRVVRRQLFLLFVIASAVSLGAEGRLVPWLALDVAVSAAFIPVVQLAGFYVIWRMRIAGTPAREGDVLRFLEGNGPWLWWWCAVAVPAALVPPQALGPWIFWANVSVLVPIVLGARQDWRWLRSDQGRTPREAGVDVVALRFVSWGAGLAWFFGIAVWYGELPKLVRWWHR